MAERPDSASSDFAERAEALDETRAVDHALIAGIAVLNAVPYVGGVVATFISEYVPRQKQARLVSFVQDLGREFEREQARVDREYVNGKEFAGMVEEVLDRVQQRKNEEKLRYWARLLAGIATTARPGEADRERMIEALDALRPSHLQLLHVIATTGEEPRDEGMSSVSATLQRKLPDVPIDEARRDWNDLAARDLVQAFPTGMMTPRGASNLSVRMTPFGRRFVELLRLQSAALE